jgi:hypothetical protein
MLAWGGSAVRVEEAFPDVVDQEDHAPHTVAEGIPKHISADTRLQLHYHDSSNGQRQLCARAIREVADLEMVVEAAERRVPIGTVVVVTTAKSGFVGRASIQRWEPKGLDYRISLRMLDSHAREL